MEATTGWPALARHIKAHPVSGSPEQRREAFDRLAPVAQAGTSVDMGGVCCERIGMGNGAPVVWAHGGGLVFGSTRSHRAMAQAIAASCGRPVLLPDYRLAPEHEWPAPLEDLLAVVDACDGPVDLGGDSAGGLLALNAALRRTEKLRSLALMSPNTDRTGLSTTRKRNSAHDLMNDDADDLHLAQQSFGDDVAAVPDASPLLADLGSLPRVWLTVATDEVLLDDSLLLVQALGRAGVSCAAHIEEGLSHLWMLWPDAMPVTQRGYDSLGRFLRGSEK
ncbi:alpha/beta hydrolase fold domain-containing protein [Croceicoccus sp. F390]|uniref:Alpha/beta hydrolase fold domain-containing protein n=1 Tax=Croceicoccus esteveae TaxID=3075597 RepID=A0ABU2ZKH8_9SPHN|nr:alpha/beta fold hydrolase [Croceicoccus sp. F390]MDT0575912.1 alpha/beta hydrolase fold domain-containing protein [Croceicoccus sp. F390]